MALWKAEAGDCIGGPPIELSECRRFLGEWQLVSGVERYTTPHFSAHFADIMEIAAPLLTTYGRAPKILSINKLHDNAVTENPRDLTRSFIGI